MGSRTAVLVAILLAAEACSRNDLASREQPAPSASVVTIGVALGTCDDPAVCERECKEGSADRCRRLAATYAFGRGVEKDETLATSLYAHACEMKDAPSCVFAGQMNEYAHGVAKDDSAAAAFYERACGLSWAAGCYNLAIMVENGRGLPRDRTRALELYEGACRGGAKPACTKVEELRASSSDGG
jgi:TPR repeat protein